MTFPDTIPAWLLNNPVIPDCPSWCTEPAGHGFTCYPEPGVLESDRGHYGFRASFTTTEGIEVTVGVSQQETSSAREGFTLHPVNMYVDGTEGLDLVDLVQLNSILREAEAVFTRITAGPAQTI